MDKEDEDEHQVPIDWAEIERLRPYIERWEYK